MVHRDMVSRSGWSQVIEKTQSVYRAEEPTYKSAEMFYDLFYEMLNCTLHGCELKYKP